MESQIWVASPGNGVQRSVQGCAKVSEGVHNSVQKVCRQHGRVHRRCRRVCTQHRRVHTCAQVVTPGNGVVGRWSGWYGCMPSAPRGENSKIFECVPVLTGLTAKNRLRVDWRGVGEVAQGQGMDGGWAQGGWRPIVAWVERVNQ